MRTAKALIRLGRCPGWSESSQGAHAILLVLSCCGTIVLKCHSLACKICVKDYHNLDVGVCENEKMDCVKRIWYLSPMRAAKVQASLRIRAVSPEPSLLAHTSSESRGTFKQKARSLAPLNGWACAVKICHDGMLKDTNSLDGAQLHYYHQL